MIRALKLNVNKFDNSQPAFDKGYSETLTTLKEINHSKFLNSDNEELDTNKHIILERITQQREKCSSDSINNYHLHKAKI